MLLVAGAAGCAGPAASPRDAVDTAKALGAALAKASDTVDKSGSAQVAATVTMGHEQPIKWT
ncbi:hypothetical protein ACM614_29055 [Streptomyces sp. 12297]